MDPCPGDIKIISSVRWHKVVLPAVNVTDNVGVNLFTTNIQNGSNITWGDYNISYSASDKAGNKAHCSFLITIAGMYDLTFKGVQEIIITYMPLLVYDDIIYINESLVFSPYGKTCIHMVFNFKY